jgi:hypothetical protein
MEEQVRGQFDGLALKPDGLRAREHRRMPQAVHQLRHGGVQPVCFGDLRTFGFAAHHGAHERMEIILLRPQVCLKELGRKLDGDELMCFVRAPDGGDRRFALMVERQHPWAQFHATLAVVESPAAGEVQAQLDAARMEAARPI